MAKKLYTASSPKFNTNVSINNTENIIAPECVLQVDTPESKNEITQRVFDIANKYLQSFVSSRNTAESCADGSCPTVYIPVIIQHYNYEMDDTLTLQGTGYLHSTLQDKKDPQIIYNDISGAFEEVNAYFQNTAEEANFDLCVQTNSQSLHSESLSFSSMGHNIRHFTDPSKLGYYTGAKIFDEETNTFIDEYVPHYSVGELHPNVKFFFPKRLRKDYLATLFPASTGCEVDANDLRNFMQNQITAQTYNFLGLFLSSDYFYFDQDMPGYVYWDMNEWNAEFFQKLNHIQKAIYNNNKALNIPIDIIDLPMVSDADIDLYNHNGATIFNELGYNYSCSAYNPDNKHSSFITSAYGTKTIKGNIWLHPNILIHEWGHAHGATHSWNSAKILGGVNARTTSKYNENNVLGEKLTIAGPNCEIKSVYNNDFKPPFIYEEPNDSHRKRLRDSQLADLEYQDLLDNAPLDRSASYSEKIEKYLERKNLLAQHLAETPETKVVDFFNLEEKEKEYVEYIYNEVVKEYTDNFTRKFVFTNGSSDGVTRARVNLNKWRFFSFGRELMNSELKQTALSSLLGIQSFWGGSIVFNDADLMATVSAQEEAIIQEAVAGVEATSEVQIGDFIEGGMIFQINEDGTGLVADLQDLGVMNWYDALDAAPSATSQGYDDWYLPSIDELVLMYNTIGNGGPEGNIGGFETSNYPLYWSSSEMYASAAQRVNFYSGSTAIVGRYFNYRVRVIRSITIPEPTEAIEEIIFEGKTYEEDFLEKIIANPDASTSLVVNPEDNLFNRRGPNVTTRIPFCVQADGTPSEDLTLNTKFDPFWAHNLNAFNPAYPEYPANTKVEDLLNDEYCPCLRLTQTYYDGSEIPYEYKIIGGTEEDLIALNRLYYNNFLSEYDDDYAKSISEGAYIGIVNRIGWSDEINIYEVTGSGSNETSTCRTCNSGTSEETGTLQEDKRFDSYALFWAHTTSQLYESGDVIKGSKYNQMVPLYKYSNGHVLNLPVFSGYSGVGGIHTAVPNVFKTRDKEIDEELVASGDKDANNIIYTKGQSVPNEYYLNNGYLALNTSLFLAAETDGGETAVVGSIGPSNFINRVYSTNNARNRYGLGFTTPGEALYNPLKDLHYHQTYVNQGEQKFTDIKIVAGYEYPTITSNIEQYDTFSNEFEHYSDLYGEYNPLYIANVMGYALTSIAVNNTVLPKEFVKKLNYHYNRTDVLDNTVYASIYEDQEDATYDYNNSYQGGGGGTALAHSDTTISSYLAKYKSIVNALDVDLVVLGCTDSSKFNYDPNATDNNGTCIDIVEGCTQSWANNYNPEANTDNGSCYAELCLDPAATGDFATGYDFNAISSAQAYEDQYNLTDIITAAETDIVPNDAFDTSNNSLCQFLVVPKRALVRFVCNAPYNDIASCNEDPLISYIEDADTGAINAHTANPIRKQAYLSELLPAEGESKSAFNISILPTVYYIKNSGSKGAFPYLGASIDEDLDSDTYHPSNFESSDIFSHIKYDYRPNTFWSYQWDPIQFSTGDYLGYKYNCVENPILPDGSGGCYLYNSNGELDNNSIPLADRLIGCSFPELESQTPFGCNNEIVFEGGAIIDVTFLQTYDVEVNSPCTVDFNNFTRYALFGAPAVNIGGSHKYNQRGLVITPDQLPFYTESDLGSYDSSILNESQIPLRKRRSKSSRNEVTNSDAVPEANPLTYSDPFNLESSIILYTEDGNSYTGKFKIAHNSETLERHYFVYDEVLKTITKQLYFRTDVLNKFNPLMTLTEREAKKFNKVTNKIINLTTFTTN